ncbi:glucose-inhibited division protein A [Mariprofundus ferrooxydans PV-1]|uniref:Glucose-inhibited division protein A n=1 Tax=Mariprofundus ferrooxydans PV-1 TaxID=314345 RepID=Q0EVY2_9PROT|nr:glucose-inhibited division protein A [Mariprofundus ferrooxydans PV-1]
MVRIIKTLEGKIASLKFYGKVISQVKMGEYKKKQFATI